MKENKRCRAIVLRDSAVNEARNEALEQLYGVYRNGFGIDIDAARAIVQKALDNGWEPW